MVCQVRDVERPVQGIELGCAWHVEGSDRRDTDIIQFLLVGLRLNGQTRLG